MTQLFILCHNEEILLPHTIAHYKTFLPNCKITIYDNESTDSSVEIAKSLGCEVISFSTQNINDVRIKRDIANNCWKNVKEGWVIMADMDEWLCISEAELEAEKNNGFSIINTAGFDMIGESQKADLTDIDLHGIIKGVHTNWECKRICFLRENIREMNFINGAHNCQAIGSVDLPKLTQKGYVIKHMSSLGLPFLLNKHKIRYERSEIMRKIGCSKHYMNDEQKITEFYNSEMVKARPITKYNISPPL